MTTRVLLRGLLVAMVLAALTSTSADAQIWRHRDARKDAVSVSYGEDGTPITTVDPDNTSSDITRLVVRHKAHTVLVDIHLRDLRSDLDANAVVRLQTPRTVYDAVGTFGRDDPGSVELTRGHRFVSCGRMSATFRPAVDRVRVRLPRTCLGDPRWVRVRASFTRFDPHGESAEGTYHDDALATGEDAPPSVWSARVRPSRPERPERPDPLVIPGFYGWNDWRPVGGEMTDGMTSLVVHAARGVDIERVRAGFDDGMRMLGARFAPPDRPIGGALVHTWPPSTIESFESVPTIRARGAHLTPDQHGRGWLLMLGYETTRPGRHLRLTIKIDYRVGDRHLTATASRPALVCAGERWRHRRCEPTEDELGGARLRSVPWTSTAAPSSSW